jgi:hypothetical protein
MSIEQEIRNEIDNVRQLKIDVGDINNHLSILEGLCRDRNQKAVDDAYMRGLVDAWEAAKKMFSSMTDSDIEKAFPTEWDNGGFKALMNLRPQEAISKLKAYEEQKADELKVGDEVDWSGDRFIVTRIYQPLVDKRCNGIAKDGSVYMDVVCDRLTKTGRHFDIDKILEEMRS